MILLITARFMARVLLGGSILAANHGLIVPAVSLLIVSYVFWLAGEVDGN